MTSAVKCRDCREGLILPDKNKQDTLWSCRFCRNPFSSTMVADRVAGIEEELMAVIDKDYNVKALESFIKCKSEDLHPKHFLNLLAQRHLIQLLVKEETITRENLKKTIKYCKAFKATMSRLDPGLSEWQGFTQKALNQAQLELLKVDLQEKKIDRNFFALE